MAKSIIHKGIIFSQEIFNYLESAQIDLVYHKPSKQIRIYIGYGDGCHDQYLGIKSIIDQANRQLHQGRIQDNYRSLHPEGIAPTNRSVLDLSQLQAGDSTIYDTTVAGRIIATPQQEDPTDYEDEDPDHAER